MRHDRPQTRVLRRFSGPHDRMKPVLSDLAGPSKLNKIGVVNPISCL